MASMEHLSRNIRMLLAERGMLVKTLAERARISRGYLSQIATGDKGPGISLDVALRIAQALDTDLATLLADRPCTHPSWRRTTPDGAICDWCGQRLRISVEEVR